jgi:colicin import membrane protein
MAARKNQRRYAFAMSVLGHAALVAMLTFSLPLSSRQTPTPQFAVIEAVVVDSAALAAEMERIEAAERELVQQQEAAERIELEQEQRRLDEQRQQEEAARQQQLEIEQQERTRQEDAERLRLAEIARREELEQQQRQQDLARQQREAEEQQRQEDLARQEREAAQRREEEERQRQQELARQREEAERQRRIAAIEAEVASSVQAEAAAQTARDAGLVEQWARLISNQIERHWNRPPSAGVGLECVVSITQIPGGDIIDFSLGRCNGDDAVKASIERAVAAASPLPPPPIPQIFTRNLNVTFKPDE